MQSRARYIILAIIWTATLSALLLWFLSTRGERLAIAAGPRGSESFELASAIAEVFNEHNSLTRIDVLRRPVLQTISVCWRKGWSILPPRRRIYRSTRQPWLWRRCISTPTS